MTAVPKAPRISQELHDRVLQLLTTIQLRSGCLNRLISKPSSLSGA
jgi:signal transduction histidine kinase